MNFLYAKSKTRIACWNVRTLGILGHHSAQLFTAIKTMTENKIELLALSESIFSIAIPSVSMKLFF